jgi:hypothetical protein
MDDLISLSNICKKVMKNQIIGGFAQNVTEKL